MGRGELNAETFSAEAFGAQLAQVVGQEGFASVIEELKNAPEHEREELARRLATPEEFARRGITVPEGFRVTIRRFEDPDNPSAEFDSDDVLAVPAAEEDAWSVCASVGLIVCASVGYAQ